MRTRITRAVAIAALSTLALTGCAFSPFGDVFAEETAAPAAPAVPVAPAQPDAQPEPDMTSAPVIALDLADVVRQTNELVAPVIDECVTEVSEVAPRVVTSDPRVTCSGQIGPLTADLSGSMIGREVVVDSSTVGAFPGLQLFADRSLYSGMTAGVPASVPLTSNASWVVEQAATGTAPSGASSAFVVTAEIDAEISLVADASVDANGAVTAVVVSGSTSVSSVPKAVL